MQRHILRMTLGFLVLGGLCIGSLAAALTVEQKKELKDETLEVPDFVLHEICENIQKENKKTITNNWQLHRNRRALPEFPQII